MTKPDTRSSNTSAKAGALVALTGNHSTQVVIAPDKTTATVTPARAKRAPKSPKYYTFTLKGNLADENIEGTEEAAAFKRDNADIIISYKAYSSHKHWTTFKKRRALEYTPQVNAFASDPNNNDDANTKLMLQKMSTSIQIETFRGYYRTNARANKFILFMTLLSNQGDDAWCWKPKSIVPALASYFDVRKPKDAVLRQAFNSLAYCPRPDKNNKGQALIKSFIPANNHGKSIDIHIFTTSAIFDIPVATLKSTQEEDKWIQQTSTEFFEAMRDAMKTNVFKNVLNNIDEIYTNKIYDPKKGMNLTKFLNKAIVRLSKVEDMEDLLMKEDAETYGKYLYQNRLKEDKYGEKPSAATTNDLSTDLLEDCDMSDEETESTDD